jgi:NTE family protein
MLAADHAGRIRTGRGEQAIADDAPRLAAIDAFRGLTPDRLRALEMLLEPMPVPGGTCLVRQGDAADALFLVVSGRFEVLVEGRPGPVTEIGAGSPVGEIAFFAGGERTATVRAQRDSLVLRLSREDFERLVAQFPQMWHTIAGRAPLDTGFVAPLLTAFRRHARVAPLDSGLAQGSRGGAPFKSSSASIDTAWFNELEGRYDYIVYIADDELTEWSRKAFRQADLVLCVGAQAAGLSADDRAPNALEAFAAAIHKPETIRLVLIHDGTGAAAGTGAWLATRPAAALHHHVGRGHLPDFERLCRFVGGKAVGLVACGGGAFSSAHIGVSRAVRDAGLTIDIMGGTSGGSAMTAAFALGLAPGEIARRIHDIFVTRRALRRWTVPRYSLLDAGELDRALADAFTGIDVEDLWIPYFALSTNLSRNAAHCIRRGPLWQAVRASSAIPALLPPVYTAEGDMLVDGCLADNVPLRAMTRLKAGPNIVIDVSLPEPNYLGELDRRLPTRRQLLWATLTRAGRAGLPQLPGPAAVLLRSLALNRTNLADALGPDDVLFAPVMPVGMSHLDWHRHAEIADGAHAYAAARLASLASSGHCLFDPS